MCLSSCTKEWDTVSQRHKGNTLEVIVSVETYRLSLKDINYCLHEQGRVMNRLKNIMEVKCFKCNVHAWKQQKIEQMWIVKACCQWTCLDQTCRNHFFWCLWMKIWLVTLRNEMTNHSNVENKMLDWEDWGWYFMQRQFYIVWSCCPVI